MLSIDQIPTVWAIFDTLIYFFYIHIIDVVGCKNESTEPRNDERRLICESESTKKKKIKIRNGQGNAKSPQIQQQMALLAQPQLAPSGPLISMLVLNS